MEINKWIHQQKHRDQRNKRKRNRVRKLETLGTGRQIKKKYVKNTSINT